MGGTMWVESEEGEGSTFHFDARACEAPSCRRGRTADVLPQLAGKRLLVVDDNATNREIVALQARRGAWTPVAVELPRRRSR